MGATADAISELMQQQAQARQPDDDKSFAVHQGDVIAELLPTRPPPGGPTQRLPRTLTFSPDVSPAKNALGFGQSFKIGVVDDPNTKIKLAASAMFPDDPQALRRFGYINGRMVFVNDQGHLENVQGGLRDWAGNFVGSGGPAMAGGIALGTGTAPLSGGLGIIGGTALGAAAGEGYRKIAANLLLNEPQTVMGNAADMGTQGVLAGAGAATGILLGKIIRPRAVKGLDNLDAAEANAARETIKNATGIELDLAQVTNNPKLKALKLWARNFPGEASEVVKANDELIAGQVDNAITSVVNAVSKETDTAAAGIRGINAAQAAIETARTQVASKAGPLYRQAFAEGGVADTAGLISNIEQQVASAKGPQKIALKRALSYFFTQSGEQTVADTSVEGLHATKLAIDAMLEKQGSTSVDRVTRRALVGIKNELLDVISQASPTYDLARQTFASETARLVDPLQNSIVGVLANVEDQQAATVAAKMFNNGNVTPQAIKAARTAIQGAETTNPELEGAWNGIVRQWLENNLNKAAKETQTGEAINVAGKFRQAIMGTAVQRQAMDEAIGGDAKDLFDTTMDALKMVSRTPTASSATEFNRLITEEMGPGGSMLRGALSPRASAIAGISRHILEQNAMKIAQALTDPTKVAQLRALSAISDPTRRALVASGVLGFVSTGEAGRDLLFPPDTVIPPAYVEPKQP